MLDALQLMPIDDLDAPASTRQFCGVEPHPRTPKLGDAGALGGTPGGPLCRSRLERRLGRRRNGSS